MKYLSLVLIVLALISPTAWAAERPLSKDVITTFYTATEEIDGLKSNYPQIFSKADTFGFADQDKAIKFMENSKAYPDIKNILSKHGFNNLTDLYDVSVRFMGGLYSVQMQKMPGGMDFNAMIKSLEDNIKNMKQNGAPPAVLNAMQESLTETKSQRDSMQFAMNKASDADKQFISKNLSWVMSVIPDAPDEMDSDS